MDKCGFTFSLSLSRFLKPYNRNRGVTGKLFAHYEMIKVKLLKSSLQVKYLVNWNMSETSPSYQADK